LYTGDHDSAALDKEQNEIYEINFILFFLSWDRCCLYSIKFGC